MIFSQNTKNSRQRSFTLLELLIVLGILAILAVIVLLVINPAEYLRRSRDVKRQTDLQTLNSAINFSQAIDFGLPLGAASTVYVSLPDATTTCANLGLPALPPTWQYHCSSGADYQKTNGTGWIPVNFNSLSTGSPLANLPIDPVNASTSNLYYVYVPGGSWELTAMFESQKYVAAAANDGGRDALAFEIGSNLTLAPFRTYLSVGSDCVLYHAYWDGTVKDHSIYGNDGTVNGASFIGKGLQFDGANDFVNITPNSSLDIGIGDYTVLYWFYPTMENGQQCEVLTFAHSIWYNWINVGLLQNLPWSGYTYGEFTTDSDYGSNGNVVAPWTPSKWFFGGYAIDRDAGGYTIKDGVFVAGPSGNLHTDNVTFNTMAYIGKNSANGYWLDGTLGEVLVFKKKLSDSEVLNIFNSTKARYGS